MRRGLQHASASALNIKLGHFAKLARNILNNVWRHRDNLDTVTNKFSKLAQALDTVYKHLSDMCSSSASMIRAELVLDTYKQYLQTVHNYVPPI